MQNYFFQSEGRYCLSLEGNVSVVHQYGGCPCYSGVNLRRARCLDCIDCVLLHASFESFRVKFDY